MSGQIGLQQKKRVLQTKILQAPLVVQNLRKRIIENANFLIEEMKAHDFSEVSEIIKACTALGIRRAYKRGLQHPINAEGDINKYIYRFNMLGALPFQDQVEPTGSQWAALVLVEDSYATTHTQSYAIINGYSSGQNALSFLLNLFPGAPLTQATYVGTNPKEDIAIGNQTFSGNDHIKNNLPPYWDNFTGGVFRLTGINVGSGSVVNRDDVADWIYSNQDWDVQQRNVAPGTDLANKINDVYITPKMTASGVGGKLYWPGGGGFAEKAFNYYVDSSDRKTQSIMVQALSIDGDAFAVVNGTSVGFTASNKLELPWTAFIPKYRKGGKDSDLPWLPYMTCALLNNIPDSENCVSSTDITAGALDRPDLNLLVPYGTNQYPYMTPNAGFPYSKKVNPEPKRIRMVIDGSPIESEDVIIQNRFRLTGYTEFDPGDPGRGIIELPLGGPENPTFTPGEGENPGPGDTVIIDANTKFVLIPGEDPDLLYIDREAVELAFGNDNLNYPGFSWDDGSGGNNMNFPGAIWGDGSPGTGDTGSGDSSSSGGGGPVGDPPGGPSGSGDPYSRSGSRSGRVYYAGPVRYQRDPVTGTNTLFTKELAKGNVIEAEFPDRQCGGTFYTIGTDTIYYRGTWLTDRYYEDMRIVIDDVEYRLISQTKHASEQSRTYYGYTIRYNEEYKVDRTNKRLIDQTVKRKFDYLSFGGANIYPDPINQYVATLEIDNFTNDQMLEYFEVGDLVTIETPDGTEYYRFQSIGGGKLKGLWRTDGSRILNGTQGATLRRVQKYTRAVHTNVSGFTPGFRIYHEVDKINDDFSMEIKPPYTYGESFEGWINRVGFSIESKSPTPDLLNSGFDTDGVGQFRLFSTSSNVYKEDSPTFFIKKAATERVIVYNDTDFTQAPAHMSAKPVSNVVDGLDKFFTSEVYNYNKFKALLTNQGLAYGDLVYPEHYDAIDFYLNEKHPGQMSFTDGNDPYITLETIERSSITETEKTYSPISHGFIEGDTLTIRKVKEKPHFFRDDPYGDCVSHTESSDLWEFDYNHCGLDIEVEEVLSPHRFKVLKNGLSGNSNLNKFLHSYDVNPNLYLTATNGPLVEYWAKYFKHVFMDGTVNANGIIHSTSTDVRTMKFAGKGTSASYYSFNYNMNASQFSHYIGSTPIEIDVSSTHTVKITGVTETDDGTFILSLDEPLTAAPRLLDAYFLRNVEFEYVELIDNPEYTY